MAATFTPGDRATDGRKVGTVEAVGGCGWPDCRHGAECVTVRFDGGFTTENRAAADLTPAATPQGVSA